MNRMKSQEAILLNPTELSSLITEAVYDFDEEKNVKRISTFEEEGVLTTDKGLVIHTADGSTFHLTIQGGSNQ